MKWRVSHGSLGEAPNTDVTKRPIFLMSNNCWWTKSCTTKDDNYPIIYSVLAIPGGAGFLPSTESLQIFVSTRDSYPEEAKKKSVEALTCGGKENESKIYVIAKAPLQASIHSSMVKFRSKGILLMKEIPKNHLTCMKPCENWDIYQKELVSLLVLFPSTESFWDTSAAAPGNSHHVGWHDIFSGWLNTPWKFHIAPENKPSQKESNLPTIIFQGLC